MKKFFCLSILTAFLISSITYSQNKNYTSSDTQINASVDEQFTVTLSSNHTTGYSWSLGMIADNSQVVVTNVQYNVPSDAKIGEGGIEVWYLKTVVKGTAKLMFYYTRPWENDKPAEEIIYTVTVK